MGTAERRMAIMKFLCRERYATMPDLATRFGVSVKTIQRDIFELTFFIPLYVKSGRHDGGVYVKDSYTMDRMYMSPDEIMLLTKIKDMVCEKITRDELSMLDNIITNYSKTS